MVEQLPLNPKDGFKWENELSQKQLNKLEKKKKRQIEYFNGVGDWNE